MKDLKTFTGLSIDENLVEAENYEVNLKAALSLVASLRSDFSIHRHHLANNALSSAVLTANALLTISQTKCTLEHPPEPIQSVIDSSGNIVLRCFHDPYHEWGLDGQRK